MKDAFKDLAEGDFEDGLSKLNQNDKWRDHDDSLDGPFYLGFPCVPRWGESLLSPLRLLYPQEQTLQCSL